ncbi:MAG: amidohydrolase [Syntrophobacteraceae bacterium]|nr:amidohydrolase [Desulfobacteraceae bacterium]
MDWVFRRVSWLVTCDDTMRCIPDGALAVDGGTLAAVGTTEEILQRFRGRRDTDLSGYLVLPGLVNAHVHGAMSCFRGLGDDLPLMQWLTEVIFPAEAAHANPDMVYWGTLLSIVEMLKNGVTTFCDGYFHEEDAARAARDSGIRAVLGQGIVDFPAPGIPDPGRARERAEAFLEAFPAGVPTLRPSLFCHAPYTCSAETMRWVKDLCRERGILFQIHLSETAGEVEELTARHGMSPAFLLDRLGILDPGTLCAHANWLDTSEIALLARRGAGVAHNPESNMKLAAGVAPVPEMLAAGVNVGLGTDGCASNNDLDLFGEMDRAAKLHKAFRRDPVVCPARRVLWMATRGGAKAVGWADGIGSLEAGKKADFAAIDLKQPHLTPLYDPVSHLVYAVKGSDVRHVWIEGRQTVCDGKVQGLEEEAVMKEVRRIAASIRR